LASHFIPELFSPFQRQPTALMSIERKVEREELPNTMVSLALGRNESTPTQVYEQILREKDVAYQNIIQNIIQEKNNRIQYLETMLQVKVANLLFGSTPP
jgi:hypothetical protein